MLNYKKQKIHYNLWQKQKQKVKKRFLLFSQFLADVGNGEAAATQLIHAPAPSLQLRVRVNAENLRRYRCFGGEPKSFL